MKNVFMYNPKYDYDKDYDWADKLVNAIIKKGYKAEADMGISQMRIFSDMPKKMVDELIKNI